MRNQRDQHPKDRALWAAAEELLQKWARKQEQPRQIRNHQLLQVRNHQLWHRQQGAERHQEAHRRSQRLTLENQTRIKWLQIVPVLT
jgi:hypothetical protein